MIAAIFEVLPGNSQSRAYLDTAAALLPDLESVDGFISIERFQSLTNPGKILSLWGFRVGAGRLEERPDLRPWKGIWTGTEAVVTCVDLFP